MIKCVLFDLDGVLIDACEWHYEALNLALQEVAGIMIERSEHESTFNGLTTKTKLNILTDQGRLDASDHDAVWSKKQDATEQVIVRSAYERGGPDEVKIELIDGLNIEDISVGCVTNSIKKTTILMLNTAGLLGNGIEFIVTNEDVQNPKPDPEGYLKAISHFGFDPAEVLIVEDSDKGFQAASATGAHVMRVANATEVTLETVKSHIESL